MELYKNLMILSLFIYINARFVSADNDLYKETDDVLRLKSDTFKQTVFRDNENVTFVVQFYNTYCGHCQMFAPIYKELATRVRNWTSVVRVAGIDCSKDENVPTCSETGIEGYPTIFIYPPKTHLNDKNEPPLNFRSLGVQMTVDDMEETIITYVGNLTTKEGHTLVADAMQPITVTSLDKITRIYPSHPGHDAVNDFGIEQELLFLVESDKSFLGRRLIIEYFRIHSKLELRRVLLSNKALLKTILTKDEYSKLEDNQPLLLRINNHESNMRAQVLVRGEANHILPTLEEPERQDFILNRFKMFFEHYYSEELKEIGGYNMARQNVVTTQKPMTIDVNNVRKQNNELEIQYLVHNDPISSKKIFAVDILKGISYMITHEIRIKSHLTPNEFNTVRNLLTILKKYLPLDKWDATLSKFILDLRTRLDENRAIYEKDGISSQQMQDLLDFSGAESVRSRYTRENWISCADSDRQSKGYTCSLWLLFHSLTVGEYTKAAPVRFRPTLVLTTMRDYITKFLGCTVCSSNFVKETEGLEGSLNQRNSSVLWLWKTHNHVNQRLNNEKQDKKKPLADVIYPKHQRCPTCYKTDTKDIGVDGRTLDDVEWNLSSVFDTMVEIYSPDRIISPVELASMLSSIRGKVNYDMLESELNGEHPGSIVRPDMNRSAEQWNIQSIFSASDMSICLFLYFCCIVIVALVCFSLNPKFKRSNSKSK